MGLGFSMTRLDDGFGMFWAWGLGLSGSGSQKGLLWVGVLGCFGLALQEFRV